MSARDRYSYGITCPACGQAGKFFVSEDDHPYIRNPDRRVDRIEGDFLSTVADGILVTAFCKKCETTFDA